MTAPAVLVLTLSLDELRVLMRSEVDAAFTARVADKATSVARVTVDELARLEACSRATIRRLVAEGAPVFYVGQSPRFEVESFRAWLDARGRQGTKAKRSSGPIAGVRLLSRRGAK